MSPNDEQLKALLKRWKDIEPKANFEVSVWRRIRLAQTTEAEHITVFEWLRRRMAEPAFSVATAAALAVAVGTWSGLRSTPRTTVVAQSEVGFLSAGTLSGSYLQLGSRGAR